MSEPVLFNTPEADEILSRLQIFPPDNHFNTPVEDWPVHAQSQRIIDAVGADAPLRVNSDMNFILVNASQPRVDVELEVAEESDPGPDPIPANIPIELCPEVYLGDDEWDLEPLTLEKLQRDVRDEEGDRHAIVIDVESLLLDEFYQLKLTDGDWTACCAAIFDLTSNKLRPDR